MRAQGKATEIKALWHEWLELWQNKLTTAENDQRRAEIHMYLIQALMNSGQIEQAKESCRKILELNPTDPGVASALNNLAWNLATSTNPAHLDPALAVDLAEKAIELAPNEGGHWNTLGVTHYRAGDWKAAITALEKSMALRNGGDSFDFFFIAMAHQRLGNPQSARQWYEKAIQWMDEKAPKNEELLRFRAEAAQTLSLMTTTQPTSRPAAAIPTVPASRPQ